MGRLRSLASSKKARKSKSLYLTWQYRPLKIMKEDSGSSLFLHSNCNQLPPHEAERIEGIDIVNFTGINHRNSPIPESPSPFIINPGTSIRKMQTIFWKFLGTASDPYLPDQIFPLQYLWQMRKAETRMRISSNGIS